MRKDQVETLIIQSPSAKEKFQSIIKKNVLNKKELIKGLQELDQTFQNVSEYSKLEKLYNK